jgi:hypothetical protein
MYFVDNTSRLYTDKHATKNEKILNILFFFQNFHPFSY